MGSHHKSGIVRTSYCLFVFTTEARMLMVMVPKMMRRLRPVEISMCGT